MPKISQLPNLQNISTGSIIPVVDNATTQKISVGQLFEFLSGALDQTFATEVELLQTASALISASLGITIDTGSYATTGSNVFVENQTISGSIFISGSIVPNTEDGNFTSSFSLGSPTQAWKDLYISNGSIIFVDGTTQTTSSFTISTGQEVKYSNGITASYYLGDAGGLTNVVTATDWNIGKVYTVRSTEQLTFSGDYVLENSTLYVNATTSSISYSPGKYFKQVGKIFIGGNLLLKDSVIYNDGEIVVGGQVIFLGNSKIQGAGKII